MEFAHTDINCELENIVFPLSKFDTHASSAYIISQTHEPLDAKTFVILVSLVC